MCISVKSRNPQQQKYNCDGFIMLHYKTGNIQFRNQGTVLRFYNCLSENQNHGRQNRYTADHAQNNTFCHNNTQVKTQRKAHEAEGDKSGNRCDAAADYR